jgi:transposase-like protein
MKCPKCGGEMTVQADGANMFMAAGYVCTNCLYIQRLLSPRPLRKNERVVLKHIREAWWVKEGVPFEEVKKRFL